MKRLTLIFMLLGSAFRLAVGDPNPVDDLFKQAQAARTAGQFDAAIGFYEQVITGHPEQSDRWFDAELNIAQTLAKKGDFAEAARAAHLCLDGSPNLGAFDNVVSMTAGILSALDKNVDRANQFLAFEQTGSGTNPMDAVGYPSQPQREAAFVTVRQQAGLDALASRVRARTYLFSGKPKDALAQYADGFRRNDNPYDLSMAGIELVCVGLRAAQGHRNGLDKAMQFVIFGPNGPDGKPGTSDDLPDPFAAYLPTVPPPGEGGLSGIDAAGLATLRQVHDAAVLYAGDARVPTDMRRAGLAALQRVNIALDGWGAPGQEDWYLRRALGLDDFPPDDYTSGLLYGAQFAARGRNLHYGGVHALWDQIEQVCDDKDIDVPKPMAGIRDQFDKACDSLGKIQFSPPNFGRMQAPATF